MIQAQVIFESKVAKAGNAPEECEDAYAKKKTKQSLKALVADGATESSFAREWANLLCKALVNKRSFSYQTIANYLPEIRKKWQNQVTQKPLPWYAEAKLEKGAFAAIAGVYIHCKKGQFDAFAIGDCCIFQVSNDQLLVSWPITEVSAFANNPFLVATKPIDDETLKERFKPLRKQPLDKGGYLFLMSDALACWFVHNHQQKERPWHTLIGFAEEEPSQQAFEQWLDDQRTNKTIKNDDTTLLIIEIA